MIRLLVLGCGSIGERHIRCLSRLGGVEITPLDPRAARLQAMQETYGTQPGLTDFAQADLSAYEAVLVATPSDQHVPQALMAAEAGCHLFVEKPLSTTLAGVDELLALCAAKQRVLQVGYVYRHHPLFTELEDELVAGRIGPVHMAHIKVGYRVADARPDFRQTYWMQAATGGGVFYDASHTLDFVQALLGPIQAVTAQVRHYEFEVAPDVEDAGVAILEFTSGAIGMATFNHFQTNRTVRLELVGAEGTINWEIEKNQLVGYQAADGSWRRHRLELELDAWYTRQMASFLEALQGAHPPLVSGEDGRRALAVVLAALKSAKTGQRIVVE